MISGDLGRVYRDGETIFREGEQGNCMYVIQFGRVNITKATPTGDLTIATLAQGEIFGEMALFDKEPRSATAMAFGDTRILTVDKKKFFSTISRDPTLAFKLLQSLSQRIRTLDEEMARLKQAVKDDA